MPRSAALALGLALVVNGISPSVGLGQQPAASAADLKLIARGKEVYAAQKCQACHSVAGVGNKRSPLDTVGSTLKGADIRQWIVAPRTVKATVRKPDYSKLPKADVDALVAYMLSLKKA